MEVRKYLEWRLEREENYKIRRRMLREAVHFTSKQRYIIIVK